MWPSGAGESWRAPRPPHAARWRRTHGSRAATGAGRSRRLVQILQPEPQWSGLKPQRLGNLHQLRQRRALQRNGVLGTQALQIRVVAVVASDHREGGQATFSSFGLENEAKFATEAELK